MSREFYDEQKAGDAYAAFLNAVVNFETDLTPDQRVEVVRLLKNEAAAHGINGTTTAANLMEAAVAYIEAKAWEDFK